MQGADIQIGRRLQFAIAIGEIQGFPAQLSSPVKAGCLLSKSIFLLPPYRHDRLPYPMPQRKTGARTVRVEVSFNASFGSWLPGLGKSEAAHRQAVEYLCELDILSSNPCKIVSHPLFYRETSIFTTLLSKTFDCIHTVFLPSYHYSPAIYLLSHIS